MSEETSAAVEATVREIRRRTHKKYAAEEKVRIVLDGLRRESTVAELCRREVFTLRNRIVIGPIVSQEDLDIHGRSGIGADENLRARGDAKHRPQVLEGIQLG